MIKFQVCFKVEISFHLGMDLERKQLESIKQKLIQIIESLYSILYQPIVPWPDVVAQCNTVVAHYESFVQELQQLEIFQHVLIHPHILDPTDPEFFPRIMLRTKLVPQIHETIQQQIDSVIDLEDQRIQDETEELNTWRIKVEQYQEGITTLYEIAQELMIGLEPILKQKQTRTQTNQGDDRFLETILSLMATGW
jgi:hypothetical protein